MILDVHTHNLQAMQAVVSVEPDGFLPQEGGFYSVGIHPWHAAECLPGQMELLRRAAGHPQVVAIGETGIDRLRGGDIAVQEEAFAGHVSLSESLGKPLVIHAVRALDRILAFHKRLRPSMPWIWHGFRGNAAAVKMMADKGIYMSVGEKFNQEAVRSIPARLLLAETDASVFPAERISARIAEARGVSLCELEAVLNANALRLFPAMRK